MTQDPLIALDNVSLRVRDRQVVSDVRWAIGRDEHWAVLGPNGAGKSTLAKSLFGRVAAVGGRIRCRFAENHSSYPAANSKFIGYVSPDSLEEILEKENFRDEARYFSGRIDRVTTAAGIILNGLKQSASGEAAENRLQEIARRLVIRPLLERNIRSLSMGEMRLVLIARALMKSPRLLILDEPFDGLDGVARRRLIETLDGLMQDKIRVVLITQRIREIIPGITHVLFLKQGALYRSGRKQDMLRPALISRVFGVPPAAETTGSRPVKKGGADPDRTQRRATPVPAVDESCPLVAMKNVTVKYGDAVIIDNLTWQMNRGENWLLRGPGGAGKTTLMKLISGDNLQKYANDVRVLTDDSAGAANLWEVKRHLSMVSPDMHFRFRKGMRAVDVVQSGFHDTFGPYRRCSAEQIDSARYWIDALGISPLVDKPFDTLSHGQRQMALIARAMVKSPVLLMLDEPCEGLDVAHRHRLLEIIDFIGHHTRSSLIYAAYDNEEVVSCMTHVLELDQGTVTCARRIQ